MGAQHLNLYYFIWIYGQKKLLSELKKYFLCHLQGHHLFLFFIFGGSRRDIGSFGQQGADVLGIFYLLLSIAKLHRGLSSRLVKEEEEEDFL